MFAFSDSKSTLPVHITVSLPLSPPGSPSLSRFSLLIPVLKSTRNVDFFVASSVSLYVRPPLDSRSTKCVDPFCLSRSICSNMLTNASLPCCPCWFFRFPNLPALYILRIRCRIRALIPYDYLGSRTISLVDLCHLSRSVCCLRFIMPLSFVALR